jgi:hypothetical protein
VPELARDQLKRCACPGAVFLFRRCYNCLPISGMSTGRGSYYKASPLIATGVESKLPPVEWPRVVKLLVEQRGR